LIFCVSNKSQSPASRRAPLWVPAFAGMSGIY